MVPVLSAGVTKLYIHELTADDTPDMRGVESADMPVKQQCQKQKGRRGDQRGRDSRKVAAAGCVSMKTEGVSAGSTS